MLILISSLQSECKFRNAVHSVHKAILGRGRQKSFPWHSSALDLHIALGKKTINSIWSIKYEKELIKVKM